MPNRKHNVETVEAPRSWYPKMYWCWSETGYPYYLEDNPVMQSAGAVWNDGRPGFHGHTPPRTGDLMMDSGGYQVEWVWDGTYPYSTEEYFSYSEECGARVVFGMDFACEKSSETTGRPIRERVEDTVNHHIVNWAKYDGGEYGFDFWPVIQGYDIEDYIWCYEEMKAQGISMEKVGIGSVCKVRDTDTVAALLDRLNEEYQGVWWHLFGANKPHWKDPRNWGKFHSADTAAWKQRVTIRGESKWATHYEKPLAYQQYRGDIEGIRTRILEEWIDR